MREPYAGKRTFPNHGQRIVHGYRLMQPASDIFLGWSRGPTRDFFIRQLRDMKIGPMVETFDALGQALAAFSKAYADQNERDHAAFEEVVRKGKVKAVFEEDRQGGNSCPPRANRG